MHKFELLIYKLIELLFTKKKIVFLILSYSISKNVPKYWNSPKNGSYS